MTERQQRDGEALAKRVEKAADEPEYRTAGNLRDIARALRKWIQDVAKPA